MREPLEKLMEKLGVDHVLSPYETQPWLHYEAEKGLTCSAEVRMGPSGDDIEAEIQFLKDEKDEEEGEEETGDTGRREQIMLLRALPVTEDQWSTTELHVKGEDYKNKIHDWEGKGCEFFRAVIQALQMGEIPDIDELIEQELSDDSWGGGRRGKVGRKSPKIKPGQLMGMNKRGM